jgi:hypothetical protein
MKQVISFDLDGVLANFIRGFTSIGHRLYGSRVSDAQSHTDWMFEEAGIGLTEEHCAAIWQQIWSSPYFWRGLDPLNVSVMRRINALPTPKVFITNRKGIHPQQQSEGFLEQWGIDRPVVYVASDKVPVAKAIGVTAHIDDYYPNCTTLKGALPHAYIALLATPYNTKHHAEWLNAGGHIVLSVDEFLNTLDATKEATGEYVVSA